MSITQKHWRMCKLGDVIRLKNGFAFKSTDYAGEGIPIIRISNIQDDNVSVESAVRIPKGKANLDFLVESGDLLIAMSGATTGKTGVYRGSEPVLQNQRVGNFKIINEAVLDRKYRNYYISSLRKEIEKAAYGGAQPNISAKGIEQFDFPLAPLDEQKRIVAEIEKQFSRLDEAVANLKRVKANLKRYKAAVLKAAVEGRLVETEAELAHREGRAYETGAQLLQRILATRRSQWQGKGKYKEPAAPDSAGLPDLPEGWVWASIEELSAVGTGATPLRSRRDYYDGGKIPWVTSGALNEEFVSSASEYITDLAVDETNAKVFPAHTLLVAMYGEGKTRGKVSELLIDAATNQACAAIIMEGHSEHVRQYTKLFLLKNYYDIRRLSSGGVQPNLNLSHIKATAVPFPPLAEQHRIVAEVDRRLSLTREVEAQVDANLQRAERLRQAVLSKAFSGGLLQKEA